MAQTKTVNMTPDYIPPRLHISQYDIGRELQFELTDGSVAYTIPSGATVKLEGTKPSGFGFTESCTVTGNTAAVSTTAGMTDEWGTVPCELVVEKSGLRLGSTNLLLVIEKSAHPEGTTDGSQETVIPTLTLLVERVEAAAASVNNLTVSATTLAPGSDATAVFDSTTDSIAFGIPRGADGTVTPGQLEDAVNSIKREFGDMSAYACIDLLPTFNLPRESETKRGIDFVWNSDKTAITASGTATATTNYNLYNNTSALPYGVKAGETYQLQATSVHLETKKARLQIYWYANGSSIENATYYSDSLVTVPSNADGMVMRIAVANADTVNTTYSNIRFIAGIIDDKLLAVEYIDKMPSNADANDYYGKNEAWFISFPHSISNLPNEFAAGVLFSYRLYNFTMQLVYAYSSSKAYKRFRNDTSGTWGNWQEISGSGSTVNQIFNEYSSTNSYTISPSITTDTNNYLAPTGDTTDVSGAILAMLNSTGICRLGAGSYWVSGVDMPPDTTIIGSGASTKVYLLGTDSTEGYAIKMNSRCTVKNLSVLGNTSDYTSNTADYPSSAEFVSRYGIIWQGNYSSGGSQIPRRGIISDCYIANFSGGGIACYDTGLNVISGVNITDCIIWHCYAGIYIPFRSEFNRITACMSTHCHYGVINNGGNNLFANCNFSKNIVGFLIDNENDQSPNNSHGSVVNCIFDHSDSNTGIGIQLLGVSYGEVFSGCQLFYSQIYIKNCDGVNINGLNAGQGETITIDGGSLVMFNDCVFRTSPTITVSNNSNVKFINCYTYDGTAVTP